MALYGRRDIPGEQDIDDFVNPSGVYDRTIRAQVSNVDAPNGIVTLDYESLPGGGKSVTVAPLWMSFPDAEIGNPAWGRFIPQIGDLVRISFDYDDRPVIVGYDIIANDPSVADGLCGWPALQEQYERVADNPKAPADRAKFAQFVPLRPGEFDFMSSGSAYIYGNEWGRLYMAGGAVTVILDKDDLSISLRSQLLSHTADDCDFRVGQVRRTDQTSQTDKIVAADASGSFKEFSSILKTTVSAGSSLGLSTLKMGNVVDSLGTVQMSSASQPARLWYQSFNPGGSESLKMVVDTMGNWDVSAPTASSGANFDFTAGDWITKFKNTTHTDTVKTVISSPQIKLGSDSASQDSIRGTAHLLALNTFLQARITALETLLVTGVTGMGPVQFIGMPAYVAQIQAAKAQYDATIHSTPVVKVP
jgi:hypothetical protein